MAHRYDVSLKSLFLRDGDGIIRRLLFGGKVTEFLSTEQPQIFNHRTDMVARTEDGSLHQVEFQTSNEDGFPLRMLEYYGYLVRTHEQHVTQTVLYLGREPVRLERTYTSPSIRFEFTVIDLRQLDARELLASSDWADNVLALFANGELSLALDRVFARLARMRGDEQEVAAGTLLLLSGILKIEETIVTRLQEVGMIDLMENDIFRPVILRSHAEGKAEGKAEVLQEQLTEKFGPLPLWAERRLSAASADELKTWAKRILHSTTLEETLSA